MLYIDENIDIKLKYKYKKINDFKNDETHAIIIIRYQNLEKFSYYLENIKTIIAVDENYNETHEINTYRNKINTYLFKSDSLEIKINILLQKYIIDDNVLTIDENFNTININGCNIKMSNKEFLVFMYLNKKRGKLCYRKEILTDVLKYHENSDTRIVDVYIRYLRLKLKEEGLKIKTIRGKGYIYE